MPVALLAEGVDRNDAQAYNCNTLQASPSSRRAWIEIQMSNQSELLEMVALLAEGVDRN